MAAACIAIVSGCGDDSGSTAPDAATDADADAAEEASVSPDAGIAVAPPNPPTPPALPAITPCADGWREVESGFEGAVGCDPWPASGRIDDCPAGEAHFPGEPGCAPVGAPCPADEWPADLPADARVVYVRSGATDGDGTRARPFGTIAGGVAAAAGAVVALAKGTYALDATVTLASRTLWGACAAETTIVGMGLGPTDAAVVLRNRDAALRNLTVRSSGTGILALDGSNLSVDGVVVDAPGYYGIHASGDGAELAVRSVVVRDTHPVAGAPTSDATALFTERGAHVTVERARLEGCVGYCVFAWPSTLELTGVSIGRVALAREFDSATGVTASQGAVVRIVRSAIELDEPPADRGSTAVYASIVAHMGSDLSVESSVLRGGAFGAVAVASATATVSRSTMDGFDEAAAEVVSDASMALSDVIVRGGGLSGDRTVGAGIEVSRGARLTAARLAMRDVALSGIVLHPAAGEPSSATIEDVTLRDVRPALDTTYGSFGIAATRGSQLTLRRARLERPGMTGVSIELASVGDIEDLVVLDVESAGRGAPDDPGYAAGGFALNVAMGGLLTARRVATERAMTASVVVYGGGSSLDIEDLDVAQTASRYESGLFGIGVVVMDSPAPEGPVRATFRRTRVAASREVGILVQGRAVTSDVDVQVDASDLEVLDTAGADCLPDCETSASGTALSVSFGARLSASGFRIARAAYSGVLFDASTTVALARGEIVESQVGLLYTGRDAFDPATVLTEVAFAGNLEDIVTRQVAVPRPPDFAVEP